ncbi:MAG: M28 family peptidase [Bacteroidetes bacterium]|nr:M28 family peptidase [Bacteroidota bacterium]MBU1719231.1 M28 family peptidase [Bacteroidota bacterium]
MMRCLLIALLLGAQFCGYAQDTVYARRLIAILASDSMYGRGYVNNGLGLAADFIAKEYSTTGLKSFGENYFQELDYTVNTFPGKMNLKIDGKEMVPGFDFIVDPSSSGGKISGEAVIVNAHTLKNPNKMTAIATSGMSNKVLVVDMEGVEKEQMESINVLKLNPFKAAGIVFLETGKLVWSVSDLAVSYPVFYVKKESVGKKIKNVSWDFENKRIDGYKSNNVVGYVPGTVYPDSFFVFTAHYDHLGMMGTQACFCGANDNASGTALMLDLAKYFQEHPQPVSIVFIAFTGEEAGLKGSFYFAKNPLFSLREVNFLYNIDLAATGDDGLMVVNATVFPKQFALLDSINTSENYMVKIGKRGEAAISDHYPFFSAGVKCFYSYTLGGITEYHNIFDRAETLPLTDYSDYFRLLRDFVVASSSR